MSALTWRQLKSLDLQGIRDAADGWGEVSSRASSARDRINNEMSVKLAQQKGESKKAADERLKVLSKNYQYICTETGLVRTALNGLAGELQPQQRKLTAALDEAETRKFAVHEDGSVSYPAAGQESGGRKPPPGTVYGHPGGFDPLAGPGGPGGHWSPPIPELGALSGEPDPNPNRQPAKDIADRIAQALKAARAVDDEYTTTIRALKTQPGLQVTGSMWADAGADANALRKAAGDYVRADTIPADKSPAERKKWWDGLTAEQRLAYLALYPREIGNLDGVPADARDEANRSYLPQLISRLRQSDDPDAETKVAGLATIENRLNQGQQPPMYLLGIGDQGNGRAIISFGNPDTARHVSSYVPGLGTYLDGDFAKYTVDRAQQTAVGAQKYDPSSASIVWLGYDAPGIAEVSSAANAEAGAPAYNRFMDGIRATNQNADPHITAIGHSYGSLTVGTAAQQPGGIPGADDIVLLGSPGVGADNAAELGVGQDHVYVGAADNDPVTKAPSAGEVMGGGIGAQLAGQRGAHWGAELGDIGDDDNWYGTDPASEAFGGRRFAVDDGPRPLVDEPGMSAHSNYFNPQKDPESADNIARVVAGLGHTVSPEQHR